MLLPLLAGTAFVLAGAESLVRGASRLAAALGITPLVIGLTVVAFGTSAPELAVSLRADTADVPDVAVGNIVGSNIFNVLVILGLSAVVAPIAVARRLVRLDVPVMIGGSLLLLLLALDGRIGPVDGAVLVAAVVLYTALALHQSRKEPAPAPPAHGTVPAARPHAAAHWAVNAGFVLLGLVLLIVGARWLVDGAVDLAEAIGLSELVIALTVVAAGTSLPELGTSVVATLRGEREIAVGNVVGSNIVNVLGIPGLAGIFARDGLPVAPAALRFDIPVLIAVSAACLPLFLTHLRITRWEGIAFLAFYALYVVYLLLVATDHAALPAFGTAIKLFVLPVTAITLAVLLIRALRGRRTAG